MTAGRSSTRRSTLLPVWGVSGARQSYRRPAGVRHDVMNGSDHPIAFIEIEVKQPQVLI